MSCGNRGWPGKLRDQNLRVAVLSDGCRKHMAAPIFTSSHVVSKPASGPRARTHDGQWPLVLRPLPASEH
jgi:hypothetical protein